MKELFLSVLVLSLTCSLLLAPLLVFSKKLQSRYAAKTLYFLWLLLAIRMVVPSGLLLPRAPILLSLPGVELRLPERLFHPSAREAIAVAPMEIAPVEIAPTAEVAGETGHSSVVTEKETLFTTEDGHTSIVTEKASVFSVPAVTVSRSVTL